MCRSLAEGGQRCHSHARARFDAAELAFQVALGAANASRTLLPDDLTALNTARTDYLDALYDLASTNQGQTELREQAHTDPHSLPIPVEHAIANGQYRRTRANMIRKAHAADGDLTNVIGTPYQDHTAVNWSTRLETQVALALLNPATRTIEVGALMKVKHYRAPEEKAAGVAAWDHATKNLLVRTERASAESDRLQALIEVAEVDGNTTRATAHRDALEAVSTQRNELSAYLLMYADKLRIAQDREIPTRT